MTKSRLQMAILTGVMAVAVLSFTTNVRVVYSQEFNILGDGLSSPICARQPDGADTGAHIEYGVAGECGEFFANDDTAAVISPGDNDLVKFIDDDGFITRARVAGDGRIFATGFTVMSDSRMKTNMKPVDDPMHILERLEVVQFDWNENVMFADEVDEGKPSPMANPVGQFGFIAQQVETVIPQIVYTDPESGVQSMDYMNLIALLVEAVKQQQQRINELSRR